MPTPRPNEEKKDFIDRCVDELIHDEGREPDQAVAMCNSYWDEHQKDKKKKGDSGMSNKVEKTLFRSDIARGIQAGKNGIDREKEIIFGAAMISKGEARGHGMEIDDIALSEVMDLGNKTKIGVKSRFGHPNMSSTALGTFLGRAKNFRRDGNVVRADIHFDKTAHKTPNGDLASYVMELAQSDPDAFGSSIIFDGDREYRLNEDGTKKRDEKTGEVLLPLIRFKKLWAADIVDDPAANNGMFGTFFNENVKLSAEFTEFLDKFLSTPDAVEKTITFLQRYASNREDESLNENKKEVSREMELKELTIDVLKAERSDLAEEFLKEGKETGVKQERDRVLAIQEKAKAFEGMSDLASELIKNGSSVEEADSKFKDKRIEELQKSAPKTTGPGDESNAQPKLEDLKGEEKFKEEWKRDPKLAEEFTSEDAYIAYRKADERGAVKIINK